MNVTQNVLTNIQILGWFAGAGSHLFTFYMYLHVKRKKREGTFVLPKLRTNDRAFKGPFFASLPVPLALLSLNEVEGRG